MPYGKPWKYWFWKLCDDLAKKWFRKKIRKHKKKEVSEVLLMDQIVRYNNQYWVLEKIEDEVATIWRNGVMKEIHVTYLNIK